MPPPRHRHNMLCLWRGGGSHRKKESTKIETKGPAASEMAKVNLKNIDFKLIWDALHRKPRE